MNKLLSSFFSLLFAATAVFLLPSDAQADCPGPFECLCRDAYNKDSSYFYRALVEENDTVKILDIYSSPDDKNSMCERKVGDSVKLRSIYSSIEPGWVLLLRDDCGEYLPSYDESNALRQQGDRVSCGRKGYESNDSDESFKVSLSLDEMIMAQTSDDCYQQASELAQMEGDYDCQDVVGCTCYSVQQEAPLPGFLMILAGLLGFIGVKRRIRRVDAR